MRIFGVAFPLDVLFRLCFHESDKLEPRFLSVCGPILGASTSRLSVAAEGPSMLSLGCAVFEVHALFAVCIVPASLQHHHTILR